MIYKLMGFPRRSAVQGTGKTNVEKKKNAAGWKDKTFIILLVSSILVYFAKYSGRGQGNGEQGEIIFRLHVFTYNRLASLNRLLTSVKNANYLDKSIDLSIFVESGAPRDLSDFVHEFGWEHGRKNVYEHVVRGGLIRSIIESWHPQADNEIVVFLEDDVEVSMHFFEWIEANLAALNKVPHHIRHSVIGISLYTPRIIETVNPKIPIKFDRFVRKNLFLYQLPCSWGAAYFAKPWKEYRDFMRHRIVKDDHVEVYGSTSNGWKGSWKKYSIEYMWMNDKYMIYPSFENQTSFSTNHLEPGEHIEQHDDGKSIGDKKHLPADFIVPLKTEFNTLITMDALQVFDLFGNEIGAINKQWLSLVGRQDCKKSQRSWGARICELTSKETLLYSLSDKKFTVLLSAFDFSRRDILFRILRSLVKSELLDKVIVTWHSQHECPPNDLRLNGKQIIFLRSSKDTLHERFIPEVRIRTSAVLILDDDILVSTSDLEKAFKVWLDNKSLLVGFFPRWTKDADGVEYRFESENLDGSLGGYRIMLTKAMFLHKKYLYEYMCGYGKQYHDFVDEKMNGEDLAMNYVVSYFTKTHAGLYVRPTHQIADFGKFISNGLQKRGQHQYSRSQGLKYFTNISGHALKASTRIADIRSGAIVYQDIPVVGFHHIDCNITDFWFPCDVQ